MQPILQPIFNQLSTYCQPIVNQCLNQLSTTQPQTPKILLPTMAKISELWDLVYFRSDESLKNAINHILPCLSLIVQRDDCETRSMKTKRQNSFYQGTGFEVKCNKEKLLSSMFQCIPKDLYPNPTPNQEACLRTLIVSIEKKN